jgi:hypothetical protein
LEELIADENLSWETTTSSGSSFASSQNSLQQSMLHSSHNHSCARGPTWSTADARSGAGGGEAEGGVPQSSPPLHRPRAMSHEVSVSNLLLYPQSPPFAQTPPDETSDLLVGSSTCGGGSNEATVIALTNRIRDLEKENTLLRKKLLKQGGL